MTLEEMDAGITALEVGIERLKHANLVLEQKVNDYENSIQPTGIRALLQRWLNK